MNGVVVYIRANEHIADLRRTAERERLARFAKRESVLARVIARLRHPERSISHRRRARLGDAGSATGATDAATAEA